ncbi:MAG: hypothetical protein ABH950_08790 [Candidatus Altiarchaeota archaeon]
MVFAEIAYTEVLGLPVIVWGGIISLLMLSVAFLSGYLNARGNHIIPFKYHKPLAVIALICAIGHGLLAIGANLGY